MIFLTTGLSVLLALLIIGFIFILFALAAILIFVSAIRRQSNKWQAPPLPPRRRLTPEELKKRKSPAVTRATPQNRGTGSEWVVFSNPDNISNHSSNSSVEAVWSSQDSGSSNSDWSDSSSGASDSSSSTSDSSSSCSNDSGSSGAGGDFGGGGAGGDW